MPNGVELTKPETKPYPFSLTQEIRMDLDWIAAALEVIANTVDNELLWEADRRIRNSKNKVEEINDCFHFCKLLYAEVK